MKYKCSSICLPANIWNLLAFILHDIVAKVIRGVMVRVIVSSYSSQIEENSSPYALYVRPSIFLYFKMLTFVSILRRSTSNCIHMYSMIQFKCSYVWSPLPARSYYLSRFGSYMYPFRTLSWTFPMSPGELSFVLNVYVYTYII